MIDGAGSNSVLSFASRSSLVVLIALALGSCSETTRTARTANSEWWRVGDSPDELPHMLNEEAPFRYPMAEYNQKIEGNVLLRLYVDTSGVVAPDSTRVTESSGRPALDAAAVIGASLLRFRPARRRGEAIAVSMMFPVHFRHPDGASASARKDSTAR